MERAWWLWHMKLAVFAALGSGCNERRAVADEAEADADIVTLPDLGPLSVVCDNPTVFRNAVGQLTGYVRCEHGGLDRVGRARCDGPPPGVPCSGAGSTPDEFNPEACRTDSDCNASPWGRCNGYFSVPGGDAFCSCAYGCATDQDCAENEVCTCDEKGSRCVASACDSGWDCPSGSCGAGEYSNGCNDDYTDFACRSLDDGCRTLDDCESGDTECSVLSGTFQCEAGAYCGRPLRAEDTPILAPAVARHDWASPTELPSLCLLDPHERAILARHWLALAALEHASVASFARFTLQLMALGAPAELVAAAQQAGLDEVRHARLCYGVAGLLNATPVGPAALDLRAVTLDFDPETVLREVVREACIGETLGAAEAFELAEHALDPGLARLWRGIAEDELRHSALGWATLRWLLNTHPHLASAAREALAEVGPALAVPAGAHLPGFGLLGPQATRALRLRTLGTVVAPATAAALA